MAGTTHFLLQDHLGSNVAVVSFEGELIEDLTYDAFGQRQKTGTDTLAKTDVFSSLTTRGYTGHEHLDGLGLIHMNGRFFDPLLARFLSADPFIQAPDNSQSYNRYSYTMNNPMNATDPSGYISVSMKSLERGLERAVVGSIQVGTFNYMGDNKLVRGHFNKIDTWVRNNRNTVRAIAVTAALSFTPLGFVGIAASGTLASTFWGSAIIGGVSGYISSGGDLRAAAIGAASGVLFHGIGQAARMAAHGTVGGIKARAMGGDFTQWFVSAGLSKTATGRLPFQLEME